jgi:hypothetical protein
MTHTKAIFEKVETLTVQLQLLNAEYSAYMQHFDWIFDNYIDDDDMMDAYERLAENKSTQLNLNSTRLQLRDTESELIERGKSCMMKIAFVSEQVELNYVYQKAQTSLATRNKILNATLNYFRKLYAA